MQEELGQLISVQEKDENEKKELRDLVAAFKRQNKHLVQQCSELKEEKQREVKLTRKLSGEDFKTKSKSKKLKATEEDLKCENPNCVNTNEDTLIKCHACGKWICETCSEARITKLKPIMKNCGTLFFACGNCVASAGDAGISVECTPAPASENLEGDIKTHGELVSSMKVLLKDHVSQIEDKMDKMIEQKIASRVPDVVTDGTTEKQQTNPTNGLLKVPEELRKIMQDAKNDDKVEENEKAKRAINFIIHGAEEFGEDAESIKKNDCEYIVDIFKHIGLASKPVSVIRIGDSKKSDARPIKITMKSKNDQEAVMSRLNRLKNTEEDFGKISITEDYTQSERDMIKSWSAKAKEKTAEDKEYSYKVRGDPKNGLRLVRFKRRE